MNLKGVKRMQDRKLLLKQLEMYFQNVSKEQFVQDLEEINCLHMIEDIKQDAYYKANDDYQALISIMERAKKLAFLRQEEEEEDERPRFRMDANGNLTRIED